jgi:predicted Zn-dependent protease
MTPAERRLAVLEKMVASDKADAFAYYGLAMEYRKAGRIDDALATFTTLRSREPSYLPMYLMAGQMLIEHGRGPEAGVELAREKGDMKTLGELESALADT